jgi:hypothetical protein
MELNYDIMGLIGQQVEIRRKMDKVVDHLKEINKVEREFRGDESLYDYFCDTGWWWEMSRITEVPEWLKSLPRSDESEIEPIDVFQLTDDPDWWGCGPGSDECW